MSSAGEGGTPETNAEAFTAEIGDRGKGEFVTAEFARGMETSRDELAAIAQSALAYLQGCEPTTVAGGVRNLALRERIKQALARAGRGG